MQIRQLVVQLSTLGVWTEEVCTGRILKFCCPVLKVGCWIRAVEDSETVCECPR